MNVILVTAVKDALVAKHVTLAIPVIVVNLVFPLVNQVTAK